MIRVGYFCTAGHTEAGGMQAFLDRVDHTHAVWDRCFPAVSKPGPKLQRAAPKAKEGLTGQNLVREMLHRLEMFHRPGMPGALDLVVFIDDADCRFEGDTAKFQAWIAERHREVSAAAQNDELPFIALFASPEVEAWFLADLEQGLGREYEKLATGGKPLRAHVELLLGGPMATVESFGGGFVNGSCANKLSERFQSLIDRLGDRYSKRSQGQDMLRRIRPEKVAAVCQTYFRPQWLELLRSIRQAHAAKLAAAAPPPPRPTQ